MSSSNGEKILKIGRKGRVVMQLDEGYPAVEVDPITAQREWLAVDATFRGEGGEVLPEKRVEWAAAAVNFAVDLLGLSSTPPGDLKFTETEAFQTIQLVHDEAARLSAFFAPRKREGPSSPASSTVRFET